VTFLKIKVMNITLRSITQDDKQFIYTLLKRTMENHYISTYGKWNDEIELKYLEDEIEQYPYQLILIDSKTAGCISIKETNHRLFINELLILPEYHLLHFSEYRQTEFLTDGVVPTDSNPDKFSHYRFWCR